MRVYNVPQLLNEEEGIERVQLYLQCKKTRYVQLTLGKIRWSIIVTLKLSR